MAHILVVEDDGMLRKLYKSLFEMNGYAVSLAKKFEEATQILDEFEVDLIFLDVNLGGDKNGFDVLKYSKSRADTKAIPVIMLTNEGHIYQMDKVQEYGAKEYVIKSSAEPKQLIELVKKYLAPEKA